MPEKSIGPYRLLSVLGQGKNTIVYKAWQSTVGRPVTLKVLCKPEADALRRLQAEAQVTAYLSDSRVRQVHDVGQTPEGHVYMALQYIDQSLKDLINQRKVQRKPFTREEITAILDPIASVLDEMHRRGLVHLDIKPENILIFKDTGQAMLADFGIVQKIGTTSGAGTPLYASPEQADGNRPVGPWSDVYSLGVVAYEMVAGRPPFKAGIDIAVLRQHLEDAPPPLRKLRREVDGDLEAAIGKALSKDPHKRFATAAEFVAALRQRQTPMTLVLKRTGALLKETPYTLKRRPWLWVIPLAVIAVVLLGGVLLRAAFYFWPVVLDWGLRPAAVVATLTPTLTGMSTVTLAASATTPVLPIVGTTMGVITPTMTIIPTVTPSPTRRSTRAPALTPTLAATPYPAPYLDKPASGAQVAQGQEVSFTWSWGNHSLKPDERYRLRFLKDGQVIGQPYVSRENWRYTAGSPGGPGAYEWCVDVVRVAQAGSVVQVLSQSACRPVVWK